MHEGFSRERYFSYRERQEAVDLILRNESAARPRPEDFADVFSAEDIQKDKQTLSRVKTRIEEDLDHLDSAEIEKVKEGKRRGEALEVIVGDQVELNDWFGPNALLTRTSEYDDVMNGIDAVAEFDFGEERKPERLALGVDASMRADVVMIERKITRNIEKVTGQREPAEVRYFESQILDAAGHPSVKGRLEAVGPVVIGLVGEYSYIFFLLFFYLFKF